MKIAALTTLACALLLGPAQADKDDSYYIAGTGNPNRDEKMYWKDAENVFQDLSQFSTLYVEFHNCAWTWMQTSDEDNDIDENDYWYMGKIPPMGANVAYSLYGSLQGETFKGCSEDTFINSFYTNAGFTNFARAMNYAGQSGFSSYSYDDDSSSKYTATCSGGYGIGCDYSNGFAVHTYEDDECNPASYTGVKDTLSSLNSAMKQAQCVQIYDSSSYRGSPYGTSLELLAYSHSCFYQDFFSPDGVCPDPYGKLKTYQKQFYNGIQESKKQDPYQVSQRKVMYKHDIKQGKVMTAAGFFLCTLALVIMLYECLIACVGHRETEMRKFVPRQQDFIITARRSKDDEDLETPTVADRSDTSSENYITMSNDAGAYTPPTNASPIVVPPPPPTPAPQVPAPQVSAPQVPTPQVPAPRVPAPVVDASPSPVLVPEVKVNEAPAVIAPVAVPPPPVPSPGNMVELKAVVQEEEVIAVFAPPCLASTPKPTPDGTVAEDQAKEAVSVATPPAPTPDEIVTEDQGKEVMSGTPPPVPMSDEMVAEDQAEEAMSVTPTPVPTPDETVAKDQAKEVVSVVPPPVSAVDEAAGDDDKEEKDEVVESEAKQEISNATTQDVVAVNGQEMPTSNTLTSSSSAEAPSSLPTSDVKPEAPALSEAPSLKSLGDVENSEPLFAGIPEASDQREKPEDGEKADAASVPSLDEIIASREFDSDSDDDVEKLTENTTEIGTEEATPDSTSDFMQQAKTSQYFDTNEIEKDDIELCREEDEQETPPDEEDKKATQPETPSEEAKESSQVDSDSAAPAESQNNEGDKQEVTQSSSWLSFTI